MITDTSIKDKVINLYDQTTYADKYGLSILIVITVVIIIFLGSSYFYVLSKLQPIKANWNEEKCNPVYMPFAGVIHDKKGDEFYSFTANNFTGCIQTILQKITNYAFLPFYYAMNVISSVFLIIINALGAIREMFDKIRNSVGNITRLIFDRILNITTPIIEMFINIKSIIAKFVGVITTVIFTMISSYLGLLSFFKVIMQIFTNILYAIAGILVALLVLSWIPGIFPIAFAIGLAMTALLIMIAYIKLSLESTLKIQTSALPSVPGF